MDPTYVDFLSTVPNNLKPFVDSLNAYLIGHQCKRTIKEAAKGYLVSYVLPSTGKTCSPTCPTGYTFVMDGVEYKKCRSMAFLPTLK